MVGPTYINSIFVLPKRWVPYSQLQKWAHIINSIKMGPCCNSYRGGSHVPIPNGCSDVVISKSGSHVQQSYADP